MVETINTHTPQDSPANKGSFELNARIKDAENPAVHYSKEDVDAAIAEFTEEPTLAVAAETETSKDFRHKASTGRFAEQLKGETVELDLPQPEIDPRALHAAQIALDSATGDKATLPLKLVAEQLSPSTTKALPEYSGETVEDADNL